MRTGRSACACMRMYERVRELREINRQRRVLYSSALKCGPYTNGDAEPYKQVREGTNDRNG